MDQDRKQFFGQESPREQALLVKRLVAVHSHHSSSNERECGTPYDRDRLIFQILRLRLLRLPELIRLEFDLPLREISSQQIVNRSQIEEEWDKLTALDEQQLEDLIEQLEAISGCYPHPEGGCIQERVSKGDNVWGFAIHPSTCRYVITQGIGSHALAKHRLHKQLLEYGLADDDWPRVIVGFVYPQVPGWASGFVRLFAHEVGEEDELIPHAEDCARFIRRELGYLTVDGGGHPL